MITNLCIGSLVYMNLSSARTIENAVNEVLATREELSANLRESIVVLQNSFLSLPGFFAANRDDEIVQLIENGYPIREKISLEGRGAYKSFFSRKERRDLFKGGTVVQAAEGELAVSYGVVDKNGLSRVPSSLDGCWAPGDGFMASREKTSPGQPHPKMDRVCKYSML